MCFDLTHARCYSSSRCCCRAREHVDPTWPWRIRQPRQQSPPVLLESPLTGRLPWYLNSIWIIKNTHIHADPKIHAPARRKYIWYQMYAESHSCQLLRSSRPCHKLERLEPRGLGGSSPSRADRRRNCRVWHVSRVSVCCCLPPYAEPRSYGKASRMETEVTMNACVKATWWISCTTSVGTEFLRSIEKSPLDN